MKRFNSDEIVTNYKNQKSMLLHINLLGHGVRSQFSVFFKSPMHGFPPFIDGWMIWRVSVFTAFVPHVALQGLSIQGPSLQSTTSNF